MPGDIHRYGSSDTPVTISVVGRRQKRVRMLSSMLGLGPGWIRSVAIGGGKVGGGTTFHADPLPQRAFPRCAWIGVYPIAGPPLPTKHLLHIVTRGLKYHRIRDPIETERAAPRGDGPPHRTRTKTAHAGAGSDPGDACPGHAGPTGTGWRDAQSAFACKLQ